MKKQLQVLLALILAISTAFLTSCKKPDTTPPVITLIGGNVNLYIGQTYTEQGATAEDTQDGNLTDNIQITQLPSVLLSGTYIVTYTVKDFAGNEGTAERIVTVRNHASFLVGKYDVYDSVTSGTNAGLVTNYTDSISISTSTDNRIAVRSFGSYVNGAVYMDVISNMTSLDIPSQSLTCGTPAMVRNFILQTSPSPPSPPLISSSNPITITFYFQEISNSTTFYKYERYVKVP